MHVFTANKVWQVKWQPIERTHDVQVTWGDQAASWLHEMASPRSNVDGISCMPNFDANSGTDICTHKNINIYERSPEMS